MVAENFYKMAITSDDCGAISPAESDQELLDLLGKMTMRFNILENLLSNLISNSIKIPSKGETYDYISKEMMFLQKIKLSSDFITPELKKKLLTINDKRNKIIHGLFLVGNDAKMIVIKYRNETIENVKVFLLEINTEVSILTHELYKIMIKPYELQEKPPTN